MKGWDVDYFLLYCPALPWVGCQNSWIDGGYDGCFFFSIFFKTAVVTIAFITRIADTRAPPTGIQSALISIFLFPMVLKPLMKSSALLAQSDLIPTLSLQNKLPQIQKIQVNMLNVFNSVHMIKSCWFKNVAINLQLCILLTILSWMFWRPDGRQYYLKHTDKLWRYNSLQRLI